MNIILGFIVLLCPVITPTLIPDPTGTEIVLVESVTDPTATPFLETYPTQVPTLPPPPVMSSAILLPESGESGWHNVAAICLVGLVTIGGVIVVTAILSRREKR